MVSITRLRKVVVKHNTHPEMDVRLPEGKVVKPKEQYTQQDLLTILTAQDMRWDQPSGGNESQNVYLTIFNDQDKVEGFIFMQIVHSNIVGVNIQVSSRYYTLDGKYNLIKTQSCSGSYFKLDQQKTSVSVESKFNIQQKSDSSQFKGYTINFDYGAELKIDVQMQSNLETPLVQIGNGRTIIGGKDFVSHKWAPYMTFQGTITCKGTAQQVRGTSSMFHAIQSTKPHLLATRFDFFSVQQLKQPHSVIQLGFKALNGTYVLNSIIVDASGVKVSLNGSSQDSAELFQDVNTGYDVPLRNDLKISQDDTLIEVAMKNDMQVCIGKIDLLGELPFLIRKVLQAMVAKPFCYMFFDEVGMTGSSTGTQWSQSAHAYHEITFVNK